MPWRPADPVPTTPVRPAACLVAMVLATLVVTVPARALDPQRLITQYDHRNYQSVDGLPTSCWTPCGN